MGGAYEKDYTVHPYLNRDHDLRPPPPHPHLSHCSLIKSFVNEKQIPPTTKQKKPSVCHMYMWTNVAEDSLSLLILPTFIIALLRNYTFCSVSKDTPR